MTPINLGRFTKDLDRLISKGSDLWLAMHKEQKSALFDQLKEAAKTEEEKQRYNQVMNFSLTYQSWYSEAKSVVRTLLPGRFDDFVGYYERPKGRKNLGPDSYVIHDYLQGLKNTYGHWGPECALPAFQQQFLILKACKERLNSSLFDMRSILQADIFASEIDAGQELSSKGFKRPAGALMGVILERHLSEVLKARDIKLTKKNPGLADLNEALKAADAIDVPTWRFVQRLADIRNLCVHKKERDPTNDEVDELISGTRKIIATVL